MENTWFQTVVKKVSPLMEEIKTHPFIFHLSDGSLDPKQFHYYMHQDSYYLNAYGKVLASISTRFKNPEHALKFMGFATGTIEVEKALHEDFINQLKEFSKPVKSPTCSLYTGYLSEVNQFHSLEVALGAVLPCFWIYKEVGDYLLEISELSENPYKKWINTYGGEDFATSVSQAIEITESFAQATSQDVRAEMTKAFLKTSKMEWMFWDSAYRMEQWPV